MQAMGDLNKVADEIMRKLEDGSLHVTSGEPPHSGGRTPPRSSDRPAHRFSTDGNWADESLSAAQLARRAAIMMEVVQRYIFDKHLDPLPDDELRAVVKSYDHLFTAAGIPTHRLRDVYAAAMKTHGQYLLKVDDYLRAWERSRPQEGDGVDKSAMRERTDCKLCGGAGYIPVFVPFDANNPAAGGEESVKVCPYRHDRALAVRNAGLVG